MEPVRLSAAPPNRAREPGSSDTATSTPRKLTALTPNTTVGPHWASTKPAIAGPTKRATCSERLLIATALSSSAAGTVDASMPWKAGKLSVPRLPPTIAIAPISGTVSESVAHSNPSSTATPMFAPWKPSSSLRLS